MILKNKIPIKYFYPKQKEQLDVLLGKAPEGGTLSL